MLGPVVSCPPLRSPARSSDRARRARRRSARWPRTRGARRRRCRGGAGASVEGVPDGKDGGAAEPRVGREREARRRHADQRGDGMFIGRTLRADVRDLGTRGRELGARTADVEPRCPTPALVPCHGEGRRRAGRRRPSGAAAPAARRGRASGNSLVARLACSPSRMPARSAALAWTCARLALIMLRTRPEQVDLPRDRTPELVQICRSASRCWWCRPRRPNGRLAGRADTLGRGVGVDLGDRAAPSPRAARRSPSS